jgi:hypothetical protein
MHPSQRPSSGQQARVSHYAGNADSYAFFNLLTGPQLLERVEAQLPAHRERRFPPTETLSMFLAQVLSADGSCQQVLNDSLVKRVMAGLDPGSSDTGAYCKSRARLPLALVSSLARETGALVAGEVPGWWLWRGRRVRLVDGTTVTLPDTKENQLKYPQPASQKNGLGFPVLRLVVLLCLATGALIDAAMGACQGKGSDEQSLFRDMLDCLESGDILVADAFYPTYFLLCELVRGGVDGVFEQFGARRRSTNFSLGESLGGKDHLITLLKPERPEWMSQWEYDQFPATLKVRELKAGGKILVTTFLDPKETSKREVAALLRRRWAVELDIRNIKTTLGMEQLRCKTPEMACKELWVYLLAYNLIRLLMAQSALLADQIPRQLSFKHSVQIWLAWQQRGAATDDPVVINALLVLIAGPRVGLRPGRIEPRCVKRRPKPFSRLMVPRDAARQQVREHGHPNKQR